MISFLLTMLLACGEKDEDTSVVEEETAEETSEETEESSEESTEEGSEEEGEE
jgi:hypothetical protein|tara:strand:+ start:593 stop:751 length:159 start_codon:yes stop_codon:yes gene_type:complete